jgi:hypothetical protein
MSHGSTKYPSKGACIYCGKQNILLTDEHVVPFSIGGKHIISKASCVMCANITKKFEQDVMRDLWGQARASYNAPTRRKKERVKSFVLKDPKGVADDLTVLAQHYPAPMIFYYMPAAGILAGTDRLVDRSPEWVLKAIVDDARVKEFEKNHPGRLTSSFKNVPQSFGRLLAKIGHSQVMTALDCSDFVPICLPYILGKKSNVSYVVGSSPTNAPPQPEFGYVLRTIQVSANNRMLLVVEVRLLANNDTPTYNVVVGEVIGSENMERISAKLDAEQPTENVGSFDLTNTINITPLTPNVWPVKH